MNFRVSLANLLSAAAAAGIVASAVWAADNLTIKEPTTPSATVRSDDVGGVHYQGFKIYDGEADSATPLELTPAQDYDTGGGTANLTGFGIFLPASGGPVPGGTATAPLRVDPTGTTTQPVSDAGGSLTVDGPLTDAQLRAAQVPVSITDGTNTVGTIATGPSLNVNLRTINGATPSTNTGTVGAGVQRVTLATDVALPTGNNNIGDVDVATTPDQKAEDAAHVSADAGSFMLGVRNDSGATTFTSTNGDYSPIAVDANGRIGIADLGGSVSVDDNAGSLTVDGTVSISGTVTVDTEFANVTDGSAAGTTGIHVLGTDGTNAQIIKTDTTGAVQIDCETGCGGGTQFAEDVGHTTGDLGTMSLAVRNDAGGALAGATGDYIPLTTDASGALRVTGGGGGTEVTEDVASAADPTGGQVMLRRRDTLAAETSADGDVVAGNATNKGELYVKHVDAIPVTDNAGSLTIDAASLPLPTGASTLTEQQTQTTALQLIDNLPKTEDTASADGDTGAVLLARRTATPANTSGADLDYEALQMAGGRLWTSSTIDAALPAGANNIGDVDVVSSALPTGASTSANQTTEITSLQIIDNLPLVDDAAFTVATTNVAAMGCIEATDTMDAGDVGAVKCGSDRELDVDLVSAIPAGTNNIGDVDVLTVPAPLSTTGGGTEATALRVTVATDSTGVLSVDDNGSALTVDNAGTFAVQPSQATAANLNAEVQGDAAHDAAVSGNPVLQGLYSETAEDTAPGNQVSAEAEAVRQAASRDGAAYVLPYGPRIWEISEEYTTQQTDTSAKAAPGAGLSFYITDISIYCNAAVTVTIEDDEVTDDILHRYYCGGQGDGNERHLSTPIKTGANQALLVTTSAAVTVFVGISGYTGP